MIYIHKCQSGARKLIEREEAVSGCPTPLSEGGAREVRATTKFFNPRIGETYRIMRIAFERGLLDGVDFVLTP